MPFPVPGGEEPVGAVTGQVRWDSTSGKLELLADMPP
jgi:hypothetical protein